jgi:hypothetical protein
MLSEKPESKSVRVSAVNEDGDEVLISSATYSERSISVSFEMLNKEYCATHAADVQSVMTAFIARLNALLVDSNLPAIVSE